MRDFITVGVALLGEAAALNALDAGAPWAALLWHAGACVIVAWRAEELERGLVAGTIAACLPFAGVAGVVLVLLPAWRNGADRAAVVVEPDVALPLEAAAHSARVAELLLDPQGSLEEAACRLRALRGLPARRALPHWYEALRDPREELRLLAHGLLARREAHAAAELARLSALQAGYCDDSQRWAALRAQAFACWEVASALRPSEVRSERALVRLVESAQAAFSIRPEAQLAVLLARALLRAADAGGAARWLERAASLGIPAEHLAALHAEAAFVAGEFALVSPRLRELGRHELRLARTTKFWSNAARNSPRARPNRLA